MHVVAAPNDTHVSCEPEDDIANVNVTRLAGPDFVNIQESS